MGDGEGEEKKRDLRCTSSEGCRHDPQGVGAGRSVLHWEIAMLMEISDGAF